MMNNEDILNELKNTFKLEGIEINEEQENRLKRYLDDPSSFNDLINELREKYKKK